MPRMVEKRCSDCGLTKACKEFSRNRSSADGFQYRCKPCAVVANRKVRHRYPEVYRAKAKRYNATHPRAKAAPLKRTAHKKVEAGLKRGAIVRPSVCERCGITDRKIHAHHSDYKKPLEICWLCPPCHAMADGWVKAAA